MRTILLIVLVSRILVAQGDPGHKALSADNQAFFLASLTRITTPHIGLCAAKAKDREHSSEWLYTRVDDLLAALKQQGRFAGTVEDCKFGEPQPHRITIRAALNNPSNADAKALKGAFHAAGIDAELDPDGKLPATVLEIRIR